VFSKDFLSEKREKKKWEVVEGDKLRLSTQQEVGGDRG